VLEAYREHVAERAALNIPAKPLSAEQVAALVELLKNPPAGEADFLLDLISNRVPPGVDEAAYVKAGFLSAVAKGETDCPVIDKLKAVELLGNMHGGYNIETLVSLLSDADLRHSTTWRSWVPAAMPTPGRSCSHGPMANGSPTAPRYPNPSNSPCSR
jgi:aconitate hydratase 2/2-methylisocitrate dehydratase